ncbi:class I SAM-dependent methyltransferase [Streptomyces parvus]|uniref:class I SAM-dependent methyltransferase n=1 Tax=Streptomyces parvus TaxID=66428 RepID=UPI00081B8166|nr:class I SAM-dependent methyltransferase [Streptomyces sp. Termitarium-T10T-6]SCE36811.1 Methyltransferase domain-containing protein [Streptomyces sp. Termitarium-T10T-6]
MGAGEEARIVRQWAAIYDAVYESAEDTAGADFGGWRSSITGENYSETETAEWLGGTVDAILGLKPETVLEIGAGTGLVAERLLPHVRRYVGTDISATAVARMERDYGHHPGTEFRCADADAGDLPGGIDVVVLNSVIHHFPGEEYLRRALARAVRACAPGGTVFLGDVHSLPLRDTLRLCVLAARSRGELTAGQVRDGLSDQAARERELVIDPAFFPAFAAEHGLVADVRLKPGACDTEMNLFRYDVRLRPDDGTLVAPGATPRMPWDSRDAARLVADASATGLPVTVTGILHPDLAPPVGVLSALRGSDPATRVDVPALLADARAARPEGIRPAELSTRAAEHGLVCFCLPAGSESAAYDAVLASPAEASGTVAEAAVAVDRPLINIPRP